MPCCYQTRRRIKCDDLLSYAIVGQFSELEKYVKSIADDQKEDLTEQECTAIENLIEKELLTFFTRLKGQIYEKAPGAVYVNSVLNDLKKKIKVVRKMDFQNTLSLDCLSNKLVKDRRKRYDWLLHDEGIRGFNHDVVLGDEKYAVITVLACIHGLFMKTTKLNTEGSIQSEKKRGIFFKQFDKNFKFCEKVNSGESIFYHVKNAVSHGKIIIENDEITIINPKFCAC